MTLPITGDASARASTPGSFPVDVADPLRFPWESVIGKAHDITVVDLRPLHGDPLRDETMLLIRDVIDPFDIIVETAGTTSAAAAVADPALSVVLADPDEDFAQIAGAARRIATSAGGTGFLRLGRVLLAHLESYFDTIDVPRTLRPEGRWIGLPGPAWRGPVMWSAMLSRRSGGRTDGLELVSSAWGSGSGSGVIDSLEGVGPGTLSAVVCVDTSLTSCPGDLAAWLPQAHAALRTTGVLGVVIDVGASESSFDEVSTEVLDATLGRVSLDSLKVLADGTPGVSTIAVMMLRKIG